MQEQRRKTDERIVEIQQHQKDRTLVLYGILRTILILKKETEKSPASEFLQLTGGEEKMKYQGITIQKNKKCDTWYTRFRNYEGKQIYISAKTQQLCYDKLKAELKKDNKLKLNPPIKENLITFDEWYNKWLKLYKQNIKERTKQEYKSSLNYLDKIKQLPINQITPILIIEILNNIKFERRRQQVYELLNAIFTKAEQNELISKNPLKIIEKPKHKRINGIALSNEDEKTFIKTCKQNGLDIFLVCLYQGLRKGEVLGLTNSDLDFKNKTMTINKSINAQNKVDTTKNIYSNRIMPMFDKTIKILEKYKGLASEERIFNIKQDKCDDDFRKINNFEKHYTIHSLRHTFITNCQEKGVPLHIIQKWVGHNIGSSVTNQVYTHTRDAAEAENIDKINN